MSNLKLDLIEKINSDKKFEGLELVRLAQDPNMNYREKIDKISDQLEKLAILNTKIAMIEQYFQEDVNNNVATTNAQKIHQNQSHGE